MRVVNGKVLALSLAFASALASLFAQRDLGARPTDSGGPLLPEQAAYDVLHYDLSVRILTEQRAIEGTVVVRAKIVHPIDWFVLDLDTPLQASAANLITDGSRQPLEQERREARIWIELPATVQPGEILSVAVDYAGRPRVAPRPPWVGGFVWGQTPEGAPWIGVACQGDGADLWWPNKDHPSDEPDTVDLHFTVPSNLVVASNGRLVAVQEAGNEEKTYHWHVSHPINNYNVTVNAAPFETIESRYQSVTGESVPVVFWVLPGSRTQAAEFLPQFLDHMHFLEERLGPYPFRDEKYGIVETPYLGMEHQSIISYGNGFKNNDFGFDWLHFHELAHEWWGNQVTVPDWKDFWIHEGFASYLEALYIEHEAGAEALHKYMISIRPKVRNEMAVAPRQSQSARQKYFVPPDYTRTDGDVNWKGAWILHTLRYVVGDETFRESLRRFLYPPGREVGLQGQSPFRFVTTDDFRKLLEKLSGRRLDWFFDIYLRRPELPELVLKPGDRGLTLRWKTPEDLPFPMPVQVDTGAETVVLRVDEKGLSVPKEAASWKFDPERWILKKEVRGRNLRAGPFGEQPHSGPSR